MFPFMKGLSILQQQNCDNFSEGKTFEQQLLPIVTVVSWIRFGHSLCHDFSLSLVPSHFNETGWLTFWRLGRVALSIHFPLVFRLPLWQSVLARWRPQFRVRGETCWHAVDLWTIFLFLYQEKQAFYWKITTSLGLTFYEGKFLTWSFFVFTLVQFSMPKTLLSWPQRLVRKLLLLSTQRRSVLFCEQNANVRLFEDYFHELRPTKRSDTNMERIFCHRQSINGTFCVKTIRNCRQNIYITIITSKAWISLISCVYSATWGRHTGSN